ncbi:hypothetical protein V2P72_01905 [Mesomycoplasma hyopneumoniae]|uniref:hypothetical protein n=1 Tax=Mesomycoplasma hyopneumoniae TaxID=2099 RepID=UPI003DA4DACB
MNIHDFRDEYVFIKKNQFSFKKEKQESENNKQLYNTYLIKNTQDLVDLILPNKQKLSSLTNRPGTGFPDEKRLMN